MGPSVADDRALFEQLSLEGFQSGLSWRTILNKREAFRRGFSGFDPARVARYGEKRSRCCWPMPASCATGAR